MFFSETKQIPSFSNTIFTKKKLKEFYSKGLSISYLKEEARQKSPSLYGIFKLIQKQKPKKKVI